MACSDKGRLYGSSALNFKEPSPQQTVIAEAQWIRVPCLTSLGNSENAPLEFRLDKTNGLLDLTQAYLRLDCQVLQKDGSKLSDTDVVSTVNNFGYSMFSAVDIYIQDQKVTQDQQFYPWVSYVKLLTSCSGQEINNILRQALWRKDSAGLMDNTNIASETDPLENKGFKERAEYVNGSKTVHLTVNIAPDFMIDRFLPEQTDVLIRLHRSATSLCLLAGGDKEYSIKITVAEMIVPKYRLSESGEKYMTGLLSSRGLTYPATRLSVRCKAVSKNDQNCEWVPFSGALPRRLFFFQISQEAFNGKLSKNIFNFQTFNLSSVQVFRNGTSVPFSQPIRIESDNASLLYLSTVAAMGSSSVINYNEWEFLNGYFLTCFDLTEDFTGADPSYTNSKQVGTLRLKLDYSVPVAEPISLFCIGEFDAMLHLDGDKNPTWA